MGPSHISIIENVNVHSYLGAIRDFKCSFDAILRHTHQCSKDGGSLEVLARIASNFLFLELFGECDWMSFAGLICDMSSASKLQICELYVLFVSKMGVCGLHVISDQPFITH